MAENGADPDTAPQEMRDMQPTDSEFMRELVSVFSAEAEERLDAIDQSLIAFERTSDATDRAALQTEIMRELHTVKGSAGAVDWTDVSRLAHVLEGLFGDVDTGAPAGPEMYVLVYRGLDAMRSLVREHAGGDEGTVDLDALMAELDDGPGPGAPGEPGRGPGLAPPPGPERHPPRPTTPYADETVRLATTKLDSLMARVGELVVTRIGAEERARRMRDLTGRIADWEDEWRQARPRYLEISAALRGGDPDPAEAGRLIARMRDLLPLVERRDGRMHELGREIAKLTEGIAIDERRLGQVTDDLEEEVRRTRMLPVSTVFDPLHRIVRDVSRDLGKDVVLVVSGGDTEVDRSVLEHLKGPLTHLMRNAVDHGVEPPDARERAGKPREARIELGAEERAGTLVVSLSDDGCGIDVARVAATATERGLISADQLRSLPERDVLKLVFRSGLSTTGTVTDISGRGVGLDAVREAVERLHGGVDVASEPGAGTTFTLSLPLSVATTHCLLVGVAGQRFAVPVSAVMRIVPVAPEEVGRAQGREMIALEDGPVVLTRLADVLAVPPRGAVAPDGRLPAVIVAAADRRFALVVDAVHGTQDVVVKPLPPPFRRVRHAAGATVLATGEVAVVLNAPDLVRTAGRTAGQVRVPSVPREPERRAQGGTVLVVDDSIVTRMLEKSILEAAGYTVRVAADGAEAWSSVEAAPVDLVVSDVNMPNMDGLALTAMIRAHGTLRDTPVVLVTSLDAPEDHARAVEVGADAYIVKSSFSQEGLLETVGRLI